MDVCARQKALGQFCIAWVYIYATKPVLNGFIAPLDNLIFTDSRTEDAMILQSSEFFLADGKFFFHNGFLLMLLI
jgi:hypothetical protein